MKYLSKSLMSFPMPVKQGGVLDLDIWGAPKKQSLTVERCPHERKVYTVCGGWRCAECREKL